MIDDSFDIDLASGQPARLIPSVSDTKREERVTSVLLAAFRVVPAFALEVLKDAGAPSGKNARIECFTEVVFKEANGKSLRPDGLITIKSGSKRWTALVESKVGSADLQSEQVEHYLDLAKAHGVNALITISNQFVADSSQSPIIIKNQSKKIIIQFISMQEIVSSREYN